MGSLFQVLCLLHLPLSPWDSLFKTGNQNLPVLIIAPIFRNKGSSEEAQKTFLKMEPYSVGLPP